MALKDVDAFLDEAPQSSASGLDAIDAFLESPPEQKPTSILARLLPIARETAPATAVPQSMGNLPEPAKDRALDLTTQTAADVRKNAVEQAIGDATGQPPTTPLPDKLDIKGPTMPWQLRSESQTGTAKPLEGFNPYGYTPAEWAEAGKQFLKILGQMTVEPFVRAGHALAGTPNPETQAFEEELPNWHPGLLTEAQTIYKRFQDPAVALAMLGMRPAPGSQFGQSIRDRLAAQRQAAKTAAREAAAAAKTDPWATEQGQALLERIDALQERIVRGSTPGERAAAAQGLRNTLDSFGMTLEDIPQARMKVNPDLLRPQPKALTSGTLEAPAVEAEARKTPGEAPSAPTVAEEPPAATQVAAPVEEANPAPAAPQPQATSEPSQPGQPLAQITPETIPVSTSRIQELMDAGRSKESATAQAVEEAREQTTLAAQTAVSKREPEAIAPATRHTEPEPDITESFQSLGARSDALQTKIDALHDAYDKQGVPFKEQLERPDLKALYDQRIAVDTQAGKKAYRGAKRVLTNLLGDQIGNSLYASVDSILREHYSLTPESIGGAYFLSHHTGPALHNPRTVERVAQNITQLLFAKEYPGADYFATMESGMSGLGAKAKADLVARGEQLATQFNQRLMDYFAEGQTGSQAIGELTAVPSVPADQATAEPTQAEPSPDTTAPPLPPDRLGRESIARTAAGTEVRGRFAVVEASEPITSHTAGGAENPAFPAELQPRDRSRVGSQDWINTFVRTLTPEWLGENPLAGHGAPWLGPDRVVEGGNGRVMGLREAYARKTPTAEAYRTWLIEHAAEFGLTPEAVRGLQAPVLVRVRSGETTPEARVALTRELNVREGAATSATEQARGDAERLTPRLLVEFVPNESGAIDTAENRRFIQQFVGEVVPVAERGTMLTADGRLSVPGQQRIRSAIFAKVYGDTGAIARLAEDPDNNVRNITSALVNAAPRFAKLQADIAAGDAHPLDIAPELASAMEKLSALRAQGERVETYLRQEGLFGADLSPTARDVLTIFDAYARSSTRLGAVLDNYLSAVAELGHPQQQSLLARRNPTRQELLRGAQEAVERSHGESTQLVLGGRPEGRGVGSPEPAPREGRPPDGQESGRSTGAEPTVERERAAVRTGTPADATGRGDAVARPAEAPRESPPEGQPGRVAELTAPSPLPSTLASVRSRQRKAAAKAKPTQTADATPQVAASAPAETATQTETQETSSSVGQGAQAVDESPEHTGPDTNTDAFMGTHELDPSRLNTTGPAANLSTGAVVQTLSRLFGVPIRTGHFRTFGRRAGIYKILERVARIRGYGNIAVAAHEVAHHIDRAENIVRRAPREARADVKRLDYNPNRQDIHEGFAEYVRIALTRSDAATVAPVFHEWFTQTYLPNSPFAESFAQARATIDAWYDQGALNRTLAQIKGYEPFEETRKVLRRPRTLAEWGYDAWVNRLGPFVRAMKEMSGETTLKGLVDRVHASLNFWAFAKVANATASARARAAIDYGMTDVEGNRVGPSLREVMEPIAREASTDPAAIEKFYAFAYARHALDVLRQGKNPGISAGDAQRVVDLYANRPEWIQAAEGLTQWHAGLIDYLVDAGGLTGESAQVMKDMYPHYIALARHIEAEESLAGGSGGRRFANLGSPIKRLKGSGREILPPLESAVTYAERIFAIADKIRVGQMLVDAATHYGKLGEIVEAVDPSAIPTSVSAEQVIKQLQDLGYEMEQSDRDQILTVFSQMYLPSPKDHILILYRDGKRRAYYVRPDLYRTLAGLDTLPRLHGAIDAIVGGAARLIRLGATGLRPGFSLITNPLRDVQTALMQTTAQPQNPVSVAVHTVMGIVNDMTDGEAAQLWKRGGGELAQSLGIDRRFTRQAVQDVLAQTPRQKVLNWMAHPVESLRGMFSVPEAGPRIAEFEAALRREGWAPGQRVTFAQYVKAQLASANVTVDFRDGGYLALWLNSIVPFFNAGIQGPHRMASQFRSDPVGTLARSLWLTLPTLALWWANKDEEWWKKLTPEERARYWHLKIPLTGQILRIPRPFEWGHIFASLPESIMEAAYRKDPKRFTEAIGPALDDLLTMPLPGLATPAVEVFADRSFYTWRPLTPTRLQHVKPEDRATETTTELGKQIGHLLGVSPIAVDHLVRGYTGGFGTDIIGGAEYLGRQTGLAPARGTRPPMTADIPVLGRLFLRSTHTRVFNDFYARLTDLEQQRNSATATKVPMPEAAQGELHRLQKVSKELQNIRANVRQVIASRTMTDDQKRRSIMNSHANMVSIVRTATETGAGKSAEINSDMRALRERIGAAPSNP